MDVEQEKLKTRLQQEAAQGKLPCRKAFALAAETGLEVAAIGKLCNKLKIKIIRCQLGCF
ncbi:MAG: hypothetical protein AB1767_10465 [Bacillota bacterium]